MGDFVNIMSNCVYYITTKDGLTYQMHPLIYVTNFRSEVEMTQAMAWISFLNVLPTFFVKESLLQLDQATINKIT